jgi:protein associated with RNAse G/E
MNDRITVVKQSSQDDEVWRWEAEVLRRTSTAVLLAASFGYKKNEITFHGITLRKGDPFIEFYSSQHWYNIYEMRGQEENQLKGWYCNIARPARIMLDTLIFDDLALDLLVYPNGRQLILDEDEFAELGLPPADVQAAATALAELQDLFKDVSTFSMNSLMG